MRPSFLNEAVRKISTDKFDQHSKSNELLKALRYLIQVNKKMQCYAKPDNFSFTWGQLDPSAVAKHLCGVCSELKEVMMKEPRMLDIASPVYIMGTPFVFFFCCFSLSFRRPPRQLRRPAVLREDPLARGARPVPLQPSLPRRLRRSGSVQLRGHLLSLLLQTPEPQKSVYVEGKSRNQASPAPVDFREVVATLD
jgi:hypothetical protein